MKNSEPATYASVIKDVLNNPVAVNDERLERIKSKFSHVINSARCMYYVRTLKDLVYLLEKRAIDGRDREELSASLVECLRSPSTEKSVVSGTSYQREEASFFPRRVLDSIADEIGRKWWDMARCLDLSEGTIKEIEAKYPFSLKQQAYQALLTFCDQPGVEGKESKLLNALAKSRRFDLKTSVERELNKIKDRSKKEIL